MNDNGETVTEHVSTTATLDHDSEKTLPFVVSIALFNGGMSIGAFGKMAGGFSYNTANDKLCGRSQVNAKDRLLLERCSRVYASAKLTAHLSPIGIVLQTSLWAAFDELESANRVAKLENLIKACDQVLAGVEDRHVRGDCHLFSGTAHFYLMNYFAAAEAYNRALSTYRDIRGSGSDKGATRRKEYLVDISIHNAEIGRYSAELRKDSKPVFFENIVSKLTDVAPGTEDVRAHADLIEVMCEARHRERERQEGWVSTKMRQVDLAFCSDTRIDGQLRLIGNRGNIKVVRAFFENHPTLSKEPYWTTLKPIYQKYLVSRGYVPVLEAPAS